MISIFQEFIAKRTVNDIKKGVERDTNTKGKEKEYLKGETEELGHHAATLQAHDY